ncbi:MAG: cob(I)yrinic acid a,c-diamide adenosyltransferase [Verrucomicrobia bacterium]|nr:MAG: cob(I)yrinic acid a,c-diamide adenosyltransferase [Verrucomicrobiota bacterium]PYJ15368.1 MAG: cob(I)yrinic acid a,c-diamide adenosyltransferase [Verrucomicrobiota bacterium]
MSIVTKTGDKGETSLMYGRRVSKADPRVDAYGCVDELSAALGLARSIASDKFVSDHIFAVQKDLVVIMGELATAPADRERYLKDGFHLTTSEMVDRITAVVFDLEKDPSLYPKDWVIPGGDKLSAALDFARTTCRRAERHIATFSAGEDEFDPEILRYLNRLSDFCWILARYAEKRSRASD